MQLSQLDSGLKAILASIVIVLAIGMSTGLAYMALTHGGGTPQATLEHYRGQEISEDSLEIPESYPMSVDHLLAITHSHIISFAFLFGLMGILVWHTSIKSSYRKFLAIEPLWGTLVTFGCIWLVRFVHPSFIWLLMTSGIMMYSIFYISVVIILRDLLTTKLP